MRILKFSPWSLRGNFTLASFISFAHSSRLRSNYVNLNQEVQELMQVQEFPFFFLSWFCFKAFLPLIFLRLPFLWFQKCLKICLGVQARWGFVQQTDWNQGSMGRQSCLGQCRFWTHHTRKPKCSLGLGFKFQSVENLGTRNRKIILVCRI